MGVRIFHCLLVAALAVVGYQLYRTYYAGNLPPQLELEADGWFGVGEKSADQKDVVPFKVDVPDSLLKDLKERLENARIPVGLEDSDDFQYGCNLGYLRKAVDYWKNSYDWRKMETVINQFPQFTTQIEGLKVHFIHAKPPNGKYKKVIPILISHGWPGNVFEFYKIIPMLTDPQTHLKVTPGFAFEVIAPSIPGYGWSSSPMKKGFDQWATARIFRKLMLRLGFEKFVVQGGDWGSMVSKIIAHYFPENVLGLHLNMLQVHPTSNLKAGILTLLGMILPPHWLFVYPGSFSYGLEALRDLYLMETGYMHLQATKPDSVGTALNDSPVGLAAYILEKFSTWTNRRNRLLPDGGLNEKYSMDELLTMVMIYWVNGNIASSQRYYKEAFRSPHMGAMDRVYLSVPTAYASFPNEMLYGGQPKEIMATAVNLTRYTEMMSGGHFAAFEEPKLLAKDLIQFVSDLM